MINTMNVFKFGGASVKDAQGVKNVATVLQQTGHTNLVIVVSAMGKMTNALEGQSFPPHSEGQKLAS